jgi:serine/threonine kinase 16
MASILADILYTLTNCLACFPSSPNLKINSRSFKILRLLGEGGFSYVYLVEDTSTHELFALKKIRCPFGQESVDRALREVEAHKLFVPHPNIIPAVDHMVVTERGDEQKTVYILLPYYRRGNLQDMINANLVNSTKVPERKLMELMLGVCEALKAMHLGKKASGGQQSAGRAQAEDEHEHEEESQKPLMGHSRNDSLPRGTPGKIRSWAHRDIKPGKCIVIQCCRRADSQGNIMIADDGRTPILMDLGSLATSPIPITSASQAIAVQDEAAEHSTMPYRAPELFDVRTDTVVDTAVDIWALGATLYACLVGKSPFEARSEETGGSLSLCILGGDWKFPGEGATAGNRKPRVNQPIAQPEVSHANEDISESVKDIVRRCLKVEPSERPDVEELSRLIRDVVKNLPPDDGN